MTEYVARHELSTILPELEAFKEQGRLRIEAVTVRGSPAAQRFKKLRAEGLDKGEAEAIAWAMGVPVDERPLFVSNDGEARLGAKRHAVPTGDLMDLVVELVESGGAVRAAVREVVAVWDDKRQSLCRPRDYKSFDETYAKRLSQRPWAP